MRLPFHFLHGWYRQLIRHPKARWWVVLATLGYLLSPVDIAPDVIPFVGQIDDAAIASILVAEVAPLIVDQLRKRKKTAATDSSLSG